MTDPGFVHRQDEYLAYATAALDVSSPLNVIVHLERARRDPSFGFDPGVVGPDSFADAFRAIDNFWDTTDFTVLYLLNLWYGYRDALLPAAQDAIAHRLLSFKYWYTEPTPPGLVDHKWYWSENHRIIFHVDEYLAGHAFPDASFVNDGRTGSEHAQSAETHIRAWLDEKVRFGFTEWHSDVYYQKDVTPLLTLVEFAPDPELAARAAMVLDLVFLDVALHLHRGNLGATHGRSYMKDKSTAVDQETFAFAKIAFDDTTEPHQPRHDAGGTLLARAARYRVPDAIVAIARSDEPLVDTERMNLPLDPFAPITADPVAPEGLTFTDPENIPFWWERGAHNTWQLLPTTIATLDRHGLWESAFFASFKPLRDGFADDMDAARDLARTRFALVLNFGLLTEVHTYTYRTADVMLSTAQGYRPGVFSEQIHAWQATLDEHAIVFTTHPKNEPHEDTRWLDSDGYWTGSGSTPRAAQHGAATIVVYAPRFTPPGPPLDRFSYLDYTHAYFPTERFDEVDRDGHWTLGRRANGYVALWSRRAVRWREHDPTRVFTRGLTQPFDLVAPGGPDNVWIAQVGDATIFPSYAAFRRAVVDAHIAASGDTVTFASPTEGVMTCGPDAPLTVAGSAIDLHPAFRMQNRYVSVPFQGRRYAIRTGADVLVLDFDEWTRRQSP